MPTSAMRSMSATFTRSVPRLKVALQSYTSTHVPRPEYMTASRACGAGAAMATLAGGTGAFVVVGTAVVVGAWVVVVVGAAVVVDGSVVVEVELVVTATAAGASPAESPNTNAAIKATTRTQESQAARTRGRTSVRVLTHLSRVSAAFGWFSDSHLGVPPVLGGYSPDVQRRFIRRALLRGSIGAVAGGLTGWSQRRGRRPALAGAATGFATGAVLELPASGVLALPAAAALLGAGGTGLVAGAVGGATAVGSVRIWPRAPRTP